MRALFILSFQQILGGKKLWILGVFLSLPILLLILILAADGFDFPDDPKMDVEGISMSTFLYVMYPQSLCILASLLYGASLLAGEIEDKTLTYLFTRAMPRWKVLLGKYLATATSLSLLTVASMTIAFLICGLPIGWQVWLALAATTVGACFAFTSVFCLLGLFFPRRALPVGLMFAVLVEGLLSMVPAVVNEFTISYYLRSIGWHIADLPLGEEAIEQIEREVLPLLAGSDLTGATMALGVITLSTLVLSGIIIHRREWPLTEGV